MAHLRWHIELLLSNLNEGKGYIFPRHSVLCNLRESMLPRKSSEHLYHTVASTVDTRTLVIEMDTFFSASYAN